MFERVMSVVGRVMAMRGGVRQWSRMNEHEMVLDSVGLGRVVLESVARSEEIPYKKVS